MIMVPHQSLRQSVDDPSAVGEARRRVSALAQAHGAGDVQVGRVALVTTEFTQNLVKYAQRGELLARVEAHPEGGWMELLSIDQGPGMQAPDRLMEDGVSTSGTRGEGLGAVRRASQDFDLFSVPGQGTVLCARLWLGSDPAPVRDPQIGAVCRPHPDEEVSGDGYCVHHGPGEQTRLLVVDGLGHGQLAADATRAALRDFQRHPERDPDQVLLSLHGALRPTRGAAVGLCALDPTEATLSFTGVGNIAGTLLPEGDAERAWGLTSSNGTAGYMSPRIQTLSYPWEPSSLLVLFSDGITTRWDLRAYPGLAYRDPAVIAGVLYRDHRRGSDDVTVVVVRAGERRP